MSVCFDFNLNLYVYHIDIYISFSYSFFTEAIVLSENVLHFLFKALFNQYLQFVEFAFCCFPVIVHS